MPWQKRIIALLSVLGLLVFASCSKSPVSQLGSQDGITEDSKFFGIQKLHLIFLKTIGSQDATRFNSPVGAATDSDNSLYIG
ncbi:MAG: hypothetical protein CVV50_00920, partial [Spirochaetae bacterium HGW-Spirochaetae-6]